MKRMYVIMGDIYNDDGSLETLPIDVVSTLDRAEDVCTEFETEYPQNIYFWYEVISSEN